MDGQWQADSDLETQRSEVGVRVKTAEIKGRRGKADARVMEGTGGLVAVTEAAAAEKAGSAQDHHYSTSTRTDGRL